MSRNDLLAKRLLAWYDTNGRSLPWRHTRDPYRILVSEIMLQQTQVPRVLLFYKKWLKQFPTWTSLANASNADVIHAWAGLGYNRRALMLRDIARQIEERGVPKTQDDWLSLKGIGPYTSAALASFSLRHRALPIDTNIRRVAGRVLLGKPFPQPKNDEAIKKQEDKLLPKTGRFFDIPQAIFDLATMICTKTPSCGDCPLKNHCLAAPKFLSGRVRIPKQSVKKTAETRYRNKPFPDRIYRGRVLKLVRESSSGLATHHIGRQIDPTFDKNLDQPWLLRLIDRLAKDQLILIHKGRLHLPK